MDIAQDTVKNELMRRYCFIMIALLYGLTAEGQVRDKVSHSADTVTAPNSSADLYSMPRPVPMLLPKEIFIPKERLFGYAPWTYAPVTRPVLHILHTYGFNGSVGFGLYSLQHPDKFFSTLEGFNGFDVPQLYLSRQMMLGNTFRLARNFYMLSGILYGANFGVHGNIWGIGERNGFIYNPLDNVSIVIWNQYYHALTVYYPVMFPDASSGAAIRMPATPEVFSFGVQANFTVGEFIIGVGTSITP